MTDETRIQDIIAQAENALDHGRVPDLAALCDANLHLLPEVQRRLEKLERLRRLDAVGHPGDRLPVPSSVPSAVPRGYELVRELGGGNMGVVYLARDSKGRQVAIKTLSRLDSTRLAYLRREFKALVEVRHANLVRIYEEVSDGTNWFCVMEYIEGKHFLDYLRAGWDSSAGDTTADYVPNGVAKYPRLRDAFRQLAEGIHALHEANKLHRDIKSSNVLVSSQGLVKLLDFGLIAELDGMHRYQQSGVVGTMAYMSPEQCGCGHLSPASDWYSFGVLLYEALTGELPYTGTMAEIISRKQTVPPRQPSEFVCGVPNDLESLCLKMLHIDPSGRPHGTDILRRLGVVSRAVSVRANNEQPAFLGRERHLQELRDAALAVKRNRAPILVEISGPSGAGKSALVERFLRELQEHGEVVILTGRCYEQSLVPYKAFDGLIESLCRHLRAKSREQVEAVLPNYLAELARLFPILGRLEAVAEAPPVNVDDPHELRRRAFQALRELLSRMCRRIPLVLFADDIQWGDQESATLFAELARLPDAPAVLFLASFRRSEGSGSPFSSILKDHQIERRQVPVEPLSPSEAQALAGALLGPGHSSTDQLVELIARESGGNPFIVHAMVEFFRSRESAEPPTLDSVVRSGVDRLDADSRRLLEVVAMSVGPLDVECAFRASDIPPERQAAALDVLLTRKFVLTAGSGESRRVETAHDRIQKTVAADLATDLRVRHHHRLAIVLKAADDTEPEVLAYHFAQAGDGLQASQYFARAGEQSAKALAFNRAAEHYRLALAGCPESDSRKSWLLAQAAALANAGLGQQSAAAFTEAGKLCTGTEALFCQQRAAEQLVRCGQIDDGMVVLRSVLVGAGIALPTTEGAIYRSLFWMRFRLWWRGFRFRERPAGSVSAKAFLQIEICRWASSVIRLSDVLLGSWFHTLGLLLSLRAGDAQGIAQGLARESLMPTVFGQLTADRIEHLHRLGLQLTNRIADPEERVHTVGVLHLYRAISYHVLGHSRQAVSLVPAAIEALQISTSPSAIYQRSTLRMFEGGALLFLGEVRRFRELFEQSYRELVEAGNLHGQVTFPLVSRAYQLPLIADSSQGARALVQQAIGLWTNSDFYQQHFWATVGELEILLYEGRGRDAWDLCRRQWDLVARERNMLLGMTRVYAYWTRARCAVAGAAQLGTGEGIERKQLLREARRLARALERLQAPQVSKFLGWSILAAIAHLEGNNRNALKYLEQAEKQLTLSGWVLHAASLAYRRGQLVGGDDGRDRIAKAEAELAAREVRNPARFLEINSPGFRNL